MTRKDIIVTDKAEAEKLVELCWQANSEQEAANMVKWLKSIGIKAKAVDLSYCREYK